MKEKQLNDWDPMTFSILKDQRQAYDDMREKCPVAHSESMGWSVFQHEDVANILADPETYSNVSRHLAIPNGIDPPAHAQYREALNPNFDREQMVRIEPLAREIAMTLLEPLQFRSEIEFIDAFANPFALKTLCAILGWPEKQWKCLDGWVHGSQQAAFNKDPVAGKELADLFSEHVKENLEKHRASPSGKGDATDALMNTEVDGLKLDDDQIVSILRNWTAGHGTVAASLGILIMHIAQNKELQERLRSDPSLIPAAIEEILRQDGPLVANPITTTREVEIQGRTIPKGEQLTLMWIAADRDPRAFHEPSAVMIERNIDDSLVWGQGIHLCQGASMARLEMRVAIEELLIKTKGLAFTSDYVPQRSIYPSNGLDKLHLRLS